MKYMKMGGDLPNKGLEALAKEAPDVVKNMGFDVAGYGKKLAEVGAKLGISPADANKYAMMGVKAMKSMGYGGKMAQEGVLNEDTGKPGVMTQIDTQLENIMAQNGMKEDLIGKVMRSVGQGRIGERNMERAMKEFGWDGTPQGLSGLPVHQIANIFKTTTQGPNRTVHDILKISANDVGADWNPNQNQLYTTIHHSGARNLSPEQLDPMFEAAGWGNPENAQTTASLIEGAVAGNVNFMGGEATGNRGMGMAYEVDTSRLGQGFQGEGYAFGKSEYDNQEGVFESGESDAIRYEFENAIETPQSFASKGALKDGTFNLNTVINRREFVPQDTPPPTREPGTPMAPMPRRPLQQFPTPRPEIIPPGSMTVTKRDPRPPLPSSGLGRQPEYVASDFLPGAAGVDERGRMRDESDTFTSSLGFPDPTVQPLNLEALRALQKKQGGRIFKFGGKY